MQVLEYLVGQIPDGSLDYLHVIVEISASLDNSCSVDELMPQSLFGLLQSSAAIWPA